MRLATAEEEATVAAFFDTIQKGLATRVFGGCDVCVIERDGIPFVCLATKASAELPAAVQAGAHAVGLPIGVLDAGAFHLDLQGAVRMAPHTKRQTIRVTEHAARLFLYSRDILGDSIVWHDPDLRRDDACIVTNPRGEAVGIGVVVGSFKGGRSAVRAVHDLGSYLRDQDESADA